MRQKIYSSILFVLLWQLSFGQCAQVPCSVPVPAALSVPSACVRCNMNLLNGYSGSLSETPNDQTIPINVFCLSVQNNQWLAFAATAKSMTFHFSVTNCDNPTNGGLQAQVYGTYDCFEDSFPVSNCFSPDKEEDGIVIADNLVIGEIYYLMLDGYDGDVCDFVITITDPPGGGSSGQLQAIPEIIGPDKICAFNSVPQTYRIPNNLIYASELEWTISPSGIGKIIPPTDENKIQVEWISPGQADICVSVSNVCSQSPPTCISVQVNSATFCNDPTPAVNANDACILPDPASLNCYYGQTTNTIPESFPPSWCTSIENNHFLAFTATSSSATFNIKCLDCTTGSGIQAAVLNSVDCENFGFTSPCFGNISVGETESLVADHLTPGTVYYLMIDGEAGALCNYSINAPSLEITASLVEACIPSNTQGIYSTEGISEWSIDPPGAGVILGSPIAKEVLVNWMQPGNAEICVEDPNCPGNTNCLPITIGQDSNTIVEVDLCLGDSIKCGDDWFQTPGVYEPCYESWLGCDSCITCIITIIPPVIVNFGEITLCKDECFEVGDTSFCTPGPNVKTLESSLGCDSTVIFDLSFLDFNVVIAPHDNIICPNQSVILDGSNSISPQNPTIEWTKFETGEVVGNDLTLEVFEEGIYCLSIEDFVTNHPDGGTCIECTEVLKPAPSKPEIDAPDWLYQCYGDINVLLLNVLPDSTITNYDWTISTPNVFYEEPSEGNVAIHYHNINVAEICVTATNDCGVSEEDCITLQVIPQYDAAISGSGFICEEGTYAHSVSVFNSGILPPFHITYSIDGVVQAPITSYSNLEMIPVTEPGIYTLNWVSDSIGCPALDLSGSAEILSFPSPDIENVNVQTVDSSHYQIGFSISGGDSTTYQVIGQSGSLNNGDFLSDPILCYEDYIIYAMDAQGCNSDSLVGEAPMDCICDLEVYNLNTHCDCDIPFGFYELSFEIEGGTAPYSIIAGAGNISGNVFTSDLLLSGDGYLITIEDSLGCTFTISESSLICDPTGPELGLMDTEMLYACPDLSITAIYDDALQFIDDCHVIQYALHDALPFLAGNIIAVNDAPIFNFQPPMELDVTYYISAIASFDDGSGSVNINDPFFTFSATSTPIVFEESALEVQAISPPTTICQGEFTQLFVEASGAESFIWEPAIGLDNPNIQNPIAAPSNSTNYTVSVFDSLGCSSTANTQVYINCLTVFDTLPIGGIGLHNLNYPPFVMASGIDICEDEDDGHVDFQLPVFGNTLTYYGIADGTDTLCLVFEDPSNSAVTNTFRIYVTVQKKPIFNFQNDNATDKLIINEGKLLEEMTSTNEQGLQIYPNPAKDILNVLTTDKAILRLELFNIAGQKVLEKQPNSAFTQLNINVLQAGSYFLKIKTAEGNFVEKVVILK